MLTNAYAPKLVGWCYLFEVTEDLFVIQLYFPSSDNHIMWHELHILWL